MINATNAVTNEKTETRHFHHFYTTDSLCKYSDNPELPFS